MDNIYYDMIFKRKSFHNFKNNLKLTMDELDEIKKKLVNLKPLVNDIRIAFKIEPNSKKGEYDICIYSEHKANYLQNVGYMAEQIDLWLASKNIGACWYGLGKPDLKIYDSLEFVIMIAIGKAESDEFRQDYTKAKRKSNDEIWSGNDSIGLCDAIKYAPSACNYQPWFVESTGLTFNVISSIQKHMIMSKEKTVFFGKIDIGIFMLLIDVCLNHKNIKFSRNLNIDGEYVNNKLSIAEYIIEN